MEEDAPYAVSPNYHVIHAKLLECQCVPQHIQSQVLSLKHTYPVRGSPRQKAGSSPSLPHLFQLRQGIHPKISIEIMTQHKVLCLTLNVSPLTRLGFPSPRCPYFSLGCGVTNFTIFVSPKHSLQRDCLKNYPGRICLDVSSFFSAMSL